jgi:hypothetical protein
MSSAERDGDYTAPEGTHGNTRHVAYGVHETARTHAVELLTSHEISDVLRLALVKSSQARIIHFGPPPDLDWCELFGNGTKLDIHFELAPRCDLHYCDSGTITHPSYLENHVTGGYV